MEGKSLPVKLQPSNLRPIAYRILSKKHGLNIQTDGLKVLTEIISYRYGSDWKGQKSQGYLEEIAKLWKNQDRGLFIDGNGLKEVVKHMNNEDSKRSQSPMTDLSNDDSNKENIDDNNDAVVENTDSVDDLNWEDFFQVKNPNEQPNYKFDRNRKQFALQPRQNLSNFLQANVDYFNSRYNLIRDRLSRNEIFQKTNYQSISNIMEKRKNNEITIIKNIIGKNGSSFILFGLLLKNIQGNFILEDASDSIELNFDQAEKSHDAFYNEGMFLIIEGIYSQYNENTNNGIFHVVNIGHPTVEKRDVSMEHYGNLDFLNINKENLSNHNHINKISRSFKKKMSKLEKQLVNNKLIILGSNLYLDDLKVLKGLRRFFNKLELDLINEPTEVSNPISLVLIGSFTSKPINSHNSSVSTISNSESYKNNFNNLTNIIAEYPNIVSYIKFIMIPGPNDPWQSTYALGNSNINYLPQQNIPSIFLNRLERLLPKGHLKVGWNPVRINYLNQEIVIMKDDLINKFKRNEILLSHELNDSATNIDLNDDPSVISNNIPLQIKQSRKLIKTLLDQGHLQPFNKDLKLINPIYDYSLRLEPIPNVLILTDASYQNFEVNYNGCRAINLTGVLTDNYINYVEYYPATKEFKFKKVY